MSLNTLQLLARMLKDQLAGVEAQMQIESAKSQQPKKPGRPQLVVVPIKQSGPIDCSNCHPRNCERGELCPDGYGGLVAKRAAGGG